MPILDERHDFAHPVESDSAWSESYYFNAYDPATDTGFFTRLGIRPHEGRMDVGLSVWLPGTDLAVVAGVQPQHEMIDRDLAVAGVRYERLEPMQTWRLTCDAEASIRDLAGGRERRRGDVGTALAADGLTQATVHVRASDATGRVAALRGDLLRVASVAHEVGDRRTIVNEGLARWTGEGHQGHGIAEYLHQLDDTG